MPDKESVSDTSEEQEVPEEQPEENREEPKDEVLYDQQDSYLAEMEYTPEFEQLLKENGDHAQVYSILHQMSYIKYKNRFDRFNIPLIVITAVIGFVTGINVSYEYMSVILGASSVFVSIMKSIVSYLKLSERSENHRICSLQFGQISNEIKIELSLRREQRQPAKIMLDIVKVKFKNLMEVAQLLDNDVILQFRNKYMKDETKYKDSGVSFPPVFSEIPGIKILGANNEEEHLQQLQKNLIKLQSDKEFESEQLKRDLAHQYNMRRIKDYFTTLNRKPNEAPQEIQLRRPPQPYSFVRQTSIGEEPIGKHTSNEIILTMPEKDAVPVSMTIPVKTFDYPFSKLKSQLKSQMKSRQVASSPNESGTPAKTEEPSI